MVEYDSNPNPDGMDPRTAGTIMFIVAVLGMGLMIGGLMLDKKSPDPMYDAFDSSHHTSSKLLMTPDMWKDRRRQMEEDAEEAMPLAPAPEPRKRREVEVPKPKAKPTTQAF